MEKERESITNQDSNKVFPVWVVYRESDPWPIRHIVTSDVPCTEVEVKRDYYANLYTQFADDRFHGCPNMAAAIAFEDQLKTL